MEFRVLGPLEVQDKGETVALGGQKQRGLLAILLLNANEVVATDRLIDELWGGEAPGTAQKALQVHVSQLRKVLEPDRPTAECRLLVTRAPGYLLQVEPEQFDLGRFEALAAEGREALAGGDSDQAASTLREALGLWRGPPLADFAYADFAQREISRLEELRLAALEDRIQADLDCGRHADVIGELERLVTDEPLRERPRAQLMLALYRSGRQAEALEAYRDARQTLTEELGIEPGRELKELEARILDQDPRLEFVAPAREPEAETDPGRAVFVGRERELNELSAGLEDAIGGRGRLFLVVGEPGIGKSRLAEQVTRQARARGMRVLLGRCWEAGGAPAYWPWVQAIRAYSDQVDPVTLRSQLAGGAGDIAQIVPDLRDAFGDLPEPVPETEGARFRLFDSAARFLLNAAQPRPLVIVLDDLHAADEPSLLLLRFVAAELGESRILIVGTYRDVDPTVHDPLASALAELAREPVTHRIELAGLTDADVARYIEAAIGEVPSDPLVAAIHAETEGNPLFVGEVARLLTAEGRLGDIDSEDLWTLGIPQGVREVIGRRLRRLSEECSRVLTLACVLGREFRLDAIEHMSELSGDELLDLLDEAVEARVLAPVAGSPGRLRFGHALIRQTLYDQLTTPRRVQLHRLTGETLEALYGQDREPHLSELAYHFVEAAPGGDVDKARDYAQRAGDRALRQLAYEEAARFYRLALQALELKEPVEPLVRCELLLAIGDALARAGNSPEAKETFAAAAERARTSGMSREFALAALGYGGRSPWLRAGDDLRLVPLLEEALAALGDGEPVVRVRLLARLAGALRDQPSLEPRSSLSRQAVGIARELGDPYTLGYALVSHFTATWGPDADLVAIAQEVMELAQEAGDPELTLDACFLFREAWMEAGDLARVAAAAAQHRALADELRQPQQQWYDAVMSGQWALFQGDFAEGERLSHEALRLGQRAVSLDARISFRLSQFALRRELGGLEEVEEQTRRGVEEHPGYRSFPCLVALLECELGREEEARATFDRLAADGFAGFPRDAEWLFCLCILSEVAAHLEDRDRAATLHELLLPYSQMNALASGEIPIGCAARYLGLAAATLERWPDAERHFIDAIDINTRMEARPWVAKTEHDYARLLLARNAADDRRQAEELLSSALETYRELGMEARAQAAESELEEA